VPPIKRVIALAPIAAAAAPAPAIAASEVSSTVNRQEGARRPRFGRRRYVRGLKPRWLLGAKRRSTVGLTAVCALVCCALAPPPALADTRPLHLGSPAAQFTSFTCLNASCSLAQATLAGTATSNLATGVGSLQATLIVDFLQAGAATSSLRTVPSSSTRAQSSSIRTTRTALRTAYASTRPSRSPPVPVPSRVQPGAAESSPQPPPPPSSTTERSASSCAGRVAAGRLRLRSRRPKDRDSPQSSVASPTSWTSLARAAAVRP
jgi:hypothetical protein